MNDARAALTNRPSDSTLEALPARVLMFLNAIATRAPIRALLYQAGFRTADHAEGWRLLMAAGEMRTQEAVGVEPFRAKSAMAEIHAWVTTNFRRYRAAIERLHPQWAGLFPEVDARYPTESLLAMAAMVESLQRGAAERDDALMALLSQRGLDLTELERLARLVADAQSVDGGVCGEEPETDDRTTELVALYRWYRDWAESAKSVVKRKDYRLTLGISAKREAGQVER